MSGSAAVPAGVSSASGRTSRRQRRAGRGVGEEADGMDAGDAVERRERVRVADAEACPGHAEHVRQAGACEVAC